MAGKCKVEAKHHTGPEAWIVHHHPNIFRLGSRDDLEGFRDASVIAHVRLGNIKCLKLKVVVKVVKAQKSFATG